MLQKPHSGARQGILSVSIKDKHTLYAAYMSYVKNGGLFIPTTKPYELGDEVFILLSLMDESEKIPVVGRVVWVTPRGAQDNRTAGIGLQFTDKDGGPARTKIETHLAGALESERPTHTM
ncbi:MAG: PilZ domain-containing protein [Nitrococcus mobilis]|nr:PilZ domain-containing protein [Nitrococcus mobilis]